MSVTAIGNQSTFVGCVVDRIDDLVIAGGQDRLSRARGEEDLAGIDSTVGMDSLYPFAHHIHFGLADGPLQGVDLTIEIGQANFVEIDQSDGSD